jgi:hypothetical protein
MQQKDELDFLHYVLNDPSIVLLNEWSHEPKPHLIPQPLGVAQTNIFQRSVLLWNTSLGDWEDCALEEVRLKEYTIESAAYVETGEIRYFIDKDNAPIIEFDRSFINTQGQLTKGRIYANMYNRIGDDLVRKDIHFENWFNLIARWLRSHFKRVEGVDGYLGPEALAWYRNGGELGK